ncbi:MAG TPA: helix-turn-helix domain-containing protein, partial [Nakamurella sp.]
VIEQLPQIEITEFIDTVTGSDDGLDPALWGTRPSTAETSRAHLVNLAARYAARQTVLARSITRAEAAQLLGISDQAVSDRLAAGDLVGLKEGRVWRLPAWQFDADTENGWLPGIAELRQHFPAGPVTLTAWVTAPNVDLGDRTPAARLVAGDVDQVLRAAEAGGPTAW